MGSPDDPLLADEPPADRAEIADPEAEARARRWASTMAGHPSGTGRRAHDDSWAGPGVHDPDDPARVAPPAADPYGRERREADEESFLAPGATRSRGPGRRARPEAADPWRTCFERDRDRILHSPAFRRLAGKTQVFVFPADHQRTRLTHALEVAQVATRVAQACRLNVALTEAIALGHDCGHGPGGHASEDALGVFLPEGFDHAPYGADVALASLNLCEETLDGIRNHSWSRPAPQSPEGEVVSWADRIAYVCHDWEDAVSAGIVSPGGLPPEVLALCGERRSSQLDAFVGALVRTTLLGGQVAMDDAHADALAAFRRCNYDQVYLRPAALEEGRGVVELLRGLVEHFSDHPHRIPDVPATLAGGSEAALRAAVAYVAGMTDRFAMACAVAELGWDPSRLPRGIERWNR